MAKLPHQRALDTLVHRCETWSRVTLRSGKVCRVFDIGWGYDAGEDVAHMTTNSSPGPGTMDEFESRPEVDFFRADEIARIEDERSGALLFDSNDSNDST